MKKETFQGKKTLLALAAMAASLCLGGLAYGETQYEEKDGVKWGYTVEDGAATITSVNSAVPDDLVVPGTLGGMPVVAIGRAVFSYSYSNLTSLVFPDSLREIVERNFDSSPNLTNVTFGTGMEVLGYDVFADNTRIVQFTIPEGNPNFSAEGGILYSKDKTVLVRYAESATAFEIPETVTVIGEGAFYHHDLTNVTFHAGLKEIRDYAFSCNFKLAAPALPSGLTVIGREAFRSCYETTSVVIPDGVSKISSEAFNYCDKLSSLTIGAGVGEICDYAFGTCTSLVSVVIPSCVTNIHGDAFVGCTSLSDVTIGSGVAIMGTLHSTAVDEWGDEYLLEAQPAFGSCSSLKNFKLADGNATFEEIGGCLYLRDTPKTAKKLAAYPSGRETLYFTGDVNVTELGETSCSRCDKFVEITIPDSVREIGPQSMVGCASLEKLTIPEGPTNISEGAFMLNMSLHDVEIAGTVKTIGALAFQHENMDEETEGRRLVLHEGIESIGAEAFSRGRWIHELVVPDSVTSLAESAFAEQWMLKSAELGTGVTALPAGLLGGCYELESVTLNGAVASVGDNAFNGCEKLVGITLDNAATIGEDAFYRCESLERVDLGVNLASVGKEAFQYCYKLPMVILPPNVTEIGDKAFDSCSLLAKAYLPAALESTVNTAAVFSNSPCLGSGGIVFYGAEDVPYATVTLDANGGKCVGVDSVLRSKDDTIGTLPTATYEGYTFDGWFTAAESGEAVTAETPVTGDATYYAHWTASAPPEPVDLFTDAGLAPSYTLQGGAAPDLSKVFAAVAGGGWKIAVTGLPSGLKFAQDKKTGDYTLTGVATKEVTGDVTFTATRGSGKTAEKETAKSTFEVVYPTLTVVAAPGKDDPGATNGVKVVGGGKYALGAKVTLKATPPKTSVFMGWFQGDELVSQNASYAYVTTAEDATFTAKFITVDEDKGAISLAVNGVAIESAETPVETNVMCGVALEWPVATDALSATTVKVAGLPAGLKFTDKPVTAKVGTGAAAVVVTNVPANTIYGAPSAASKVDKNKGVVPTDVKITVATAGKSSVTYILKLTVDPLPAWAVGNFEGVAGSGSATMSVAASGKVSGKIALMGTNWTFKADAFAKESETVGATNFVLNLAAASGKVTGDLALTLSALPTEDLPQSATALADGTFGEGKAQLWRLPWADKGDADAAKLVATLAGAYSCSAAYGSGSCDVTFTLDEKGAVKGSLVAPDGSKTRKASFSANALPKADGIYAAIVLPPDAKKGYPAVCEVVELIGQAGAPEKGVAYRDPGVVAAVAERTPGSGASGTVTVSPKYGQVAAGKDVSLTAKPSDKHSVFYRWEITGLDTEGLDLSAATLKFKSPGTNDVVATAVFVKDTEDADSVELTVDGVDLKAAVPTWSNYCGVAVNWDVEATALSATTVKATGLPAGLKLVQDKKTKAYTVEGVPTAASKAAKGSTELAPSPVKFTVTTAGKSSKDFTVNLVVLPLPAWAAGTFDGAAYAPGGDPVEGVVQALTIDAKGKIGGKILKNGETWTLSANSFESVDGLDDPENLAFCATVIGKNGKLLETNSVTVSATGVEGVTFALSASSWSAYQNLWKRADTKGEQPVFKASFDRTVELGEKGDADNTVKLTFKKDGAVAFAGKVKGTKVSGSSQLVNDGKGWSVTLYAPPKAPFDGWSETFTVTLKTDEKNVVTDVTVEAPSAEPPPAWGVGEYIGYGQVDYLPATLGGLPETLWGLVYIDMAADFSFTGRFVPVSGPGSPAQFTGKMYRIPEMFGYLADNVEINVNGANALLHFQFITMGFGKMSGQSTQSSSNVTGISFWDVIHNIWARDDFPRERPTFASGATKSIDLKDYPGLYDQAGKEYADTPGDALTFVFGEDGKVAVTGQIFGVAVNSTATLGVEMEYEEDAKLDCIAYFGANGRIYSLTCEIPSSGTVTSDDIVLSGLGLFNGW